MAKSKAGKDLRAQAQDLMNELPDETVSGRKVDDSGSPMSDEQFAKDKAEAMQGDPTAAGQMSMHGKRGNQQKS